MKFHTIQSIYCEYSFRFRKHAERLKSKHHNISSVANNFISFPSCIELRITFSQYFEWKLKIL